MKISIGNDHAGPDYKKAILQYLEEKGHTVYNHGTDTFESVDYPDFGHPVAYDVESKHQDIRAALCWTKEIAALARQHNDANIISIPARYTSIQQSIEMVDTFLTTSFEGGRHANRVHKIACK